MTSGMTFLEQKAEYVCVSCVSAVLRVWHNAMMSNIIVSLSCGWIAWSVCTNAKGYGGPSVSHSNVFHALNCEAFAQQILSQCDSEGEAAMFHQWHKKERKPPV